MATEEERCAEARKFRRIDAAFHAGDLDALRAAVDDPALVPNGRMPDTIGSCLVYAIYHSPFAFIRTLLDIGADPNAPVDDGFPPLIAALSCTRAEPGTTPRSDVDDIIRLLLASGADPNQRGINDYTALHMAVGGRNAMAIQILLEAARIPNCARGSMPATRRAEMAASAGLIDLAATLAAPRSAAAAAPALGPDAARGHSRSGEPVRRRTSTGHD